MFGLPRMSSVWAGRASLVQACAADLHLKADGSQRLLGVPTLKDKIVQSAVAEMLS